MFRQPICYNGRRFHRTNEMNSVAALLLTTRCNIMRPSLCKVALRIDNSWMSAYVVGQNMLKYLKIRCIRHLRYVLWLSRAASDLRKTLKYSQSRDLAGIQWILWICTDAAPYWLAPQLPSVNSLCHFVFILWFVLFFSLPYYGE